jgi:hypothetical protein
VADKRYQVFVSSTYEDLQEERREVMQALLALDCIPTGMELFPAADEDSWSLIERFISECDYYVVIIGGRYGSVAPDGRSFTEMEYDYAVKAGIPVLAFLHKDPGTLLANKTEDSDKGRTALEAFRGKIKMGRNAKHWTSPKELPGLVVMSMSSLMKIKPRTGWVRADRVPDESAAQEMLRLRERLEAAELKLAIVQALRSKDTEHLSQGEERISLRCTFTNAQGSFGEQAYPFSWNELVAILGPVLLTPVTEQGLTLTLQSVVQNQVRDKGGEIHNVRVRGEDFQKVKIQFRALGLITGVEGPVPLWTLTPHGDRLMTQVAAIKSKKVSQPG